MIISADFTLNKRLIVCKSWFYSIIHIIFFKCSFIPLWHTCLTSTYWLFQLKTPPRPSSLSPPPPPPPSLQQPTPQLSVTARGQLTSQWRWGNLRCSAAACPTLLPVSRSPSTVVTAATPSPAPVATWKMSPRWGGPCPPYLVSSLCPLLPLTDTQMDYFSVLKSSLFNCKLQIYFFSTFPNLGLHSIETSLH